MSTRPRLKSEDDRHEPNTPERVLMALSAVFTAAVFAYVGYHALVTPDEAVLEARAVSTETQPDGSVHVEIELANAGGVGMRTAEVEVACDEPAPSITFDNVPVASERTGTVSCPPGTEDPEVSVVSYAPT